MQRAVDFCRRHGLAPIPRCGGHSYGGAINGVAPDATAFVHRDALCQLEISGTWGSASSRATIEQVQAWLTHTARAIGPYTNGQSYENYIDQSLADWKTAYYGANLPRLERIKRAHDPDDVFAFPQAIPPARRATHSAVR